MSMVAPEGSVYQAGTLSGNPLAVAAGMATLDALIETNPYEALETRTCETVSQVRDLAKTNGVSVTINHVASLFTIFFTERPVTDVGSAKRSDAQRYALLHRALLQRGIYLAPSPFEAAFLSTAHSDADLEQTLKVFGEVLSTNHNPFLGED